MPSRDRVLGFCRFLRRLLVGTVVCYVGVALTLGGTASAPTVFRALALGWAVVLVGGHYVARGRPAPGRRTRPAGAAELVVSNIALTLLLAEGALQALAACGAPSLLLSDALDGYRLSPGRDYGAGLRANALGYPGPDIAQQRRPGVARVVALGDSFAVGPAVPFSDNYLTRLGKALPDVEVCNLGISGAGPREYRAALARDGWALWPDLVLVSVFVGNDITEAVPRPRYLDPRGHALYRLCRRGWLLAREPRRPAAAPPEAPDRLSAPPLSEATFRAVEARRLKVCLSPPSAAMEKKWRRALAHLDALIADCRGRAVPVAFVLIPDEFQVNPAVFDQAVRDGAADRARIDLELPQRRLTAFCAARGVPCLDLVAALRAVPATYAPCDTHWNRRGNRVAAAELAAWLPKVQRQ